MKKIFITLLLTVSSIALFANEGVKSSVQKNEKSLCVQTVTITEEAEAPCGEDWVVIVTVTKTATSIAETCDLANRLATAAATLAAVQQLNSDIQTINYICN